MFGFRKKKPAPPLVPGNPGQGSGVKAAFAGERNWTESVDLVSVAALAFKKFSYSITNHESWIEHRETGFAIQPQFVDWQLLERGGVRTVTTIQINHPTLISQGVFEYQHATGDSLGQSFANGFEQWLQVDWVALVDATRATPETCMVLQMEFPAKDGKSALVRRAVLSPVAQLMTQPAPPVAETGEDEHSFCPCCLLTRSFDAFRGLVEEDQFYALRLYAARDARGEAQSDCRINGEDWEPGAQALRQYVATWPPAGFEFRKQYVVLQSMERAK